MEDTLTLINIPEEGISSVMEINKEEPLVEQQEEIEQEDPSKLTEEEIESIRNKVPTDYFRIGEDCTAEEVVKKIPVTETLTYAIIPDRVYALFRIVALETAYEPIPELSGLYTSIDKAEADIKACLASDMFAHRQYMEKVASEKKEREAIKQYWLNIQREGMEKRKLEKAEKEKIHKEVILEIKKEGLTKAYKQATEAKKVNAKKYKRINATNKANKLEKKIKEVEKQIDIVSIPEPTE